MIVLQKSLPRRTFLRGLGATVALPLLDAMVPAFASTGSAAAPVRRLGFVYIPNGAIMDKWTPAATAHSSCRRPCSRWPRFAISWW